jgi:hypothetical protein
MERMMRIRTEHDGFDVVDEDAEDRHLVAMVNEARDEAEIESIVSMARKRRRNAVAAAERGLRRRRGHLFGRPLSSRR